MFEGVVEVGDEVVDVFDADGDADEVIGDADVVADVFGDGDVSHGGGVFDEGLDAAEGFGECEEFNGGEEAEGVVFSAVESEGEGPA